MKKDLLVQKTDLAIGELVHDKDKLKKSYNYYNCKRDEEQFKYLEENYGIGQPTNVEFIPLIRKHVDALVGEYLDVPILPKVSCKDKETIHNIFREKQVVEIQTIGAGSLNQAVKAVCIARGFLAPGGDDIVIVPSFNDIEIDGEQKTAMKLVIEKK